MEDRVQHWGFALEKLLEKKHTILYRPTETRPLVQDTPGKPAMIYEPQPIFKELTGADVAVVNFDELDGQAFREVLYSKVQGRHIYGLKKKLELNKIAEVLSHLADEIASTPEALAGNLLEADIFRRRSLSELKDLLLSSLQDELWELFLKEDRKDPEFRSAILTSQFGNLMRHMTHDKELNPNARPIGSRKDEIAQAGDAVAQLVMYLISRNVELPDAYDSGLVRMREEVWRKVRAEEMEPSVLEELAPSSPDEIVAGIAGCYGTVRGPAVVVKSIEDTRKLRRFREGCVVVMDMYKDKIWDNIRNDFEYVKGMVVEVGSENIHVAIVCREYGKPCIVSARNATTVVSDGQEIELDVGEERGVVRKLRSTGEKK